MNEEQKMIGDFITVVNQKTGTDISVCSVDIGNLIDRAVKEEREKIIDRVFESDIASWEKEDINIIVEVINDLSTEGK